MYAVFFYQVKVSSGITEKKIEYIRKNAIL